LETFFVVGLVLGTAQELMSKFGKLFFKKKYKMPRKIQKYLQS